ncbi:MAG: DUF4339 domain-containing protein [Pseudomonadota bacterium]
MAPLPNPTKPLRRVKPGPLDLADVDPPRWRVFAKGREHGPFTLGQMRAFAEKGRIGPGALIAAGDGAALIPARDAPELAACFKRDASGSDAAQSEPGNFVVVAQLSEASEGALIHALNGLGRFADAGRHTFVLRSRVTLAQIQTALQHALTSKDTALIVDASRDRLAWVNQDPGAGTHLRSVWAGKLD